MRHIAQAAIFRLVSSNTDIKVPFTGRGSIPDVSLNTYKWYMGYLYVAVLSNNSDISALFSMGIKPTSNYDEMNKLPELEQKALDSIKVQEAEKLFKQEFGTGSDELLSKLSKLRIQKTPATDKPFYELLGHVLTVSADPINFDDLKVKVTKTNVVLESDSLNLRSVVGEKDALRYRLTLDQVKTWLTEKGFGKYKAPKYVRRAPLYD